MMMFKDKQGVFHYFIEGETGDVDTLRRHYCVALNLLESTQETMRDLTSKLQAAQAQIAGK